VRWIGDVAGDCCDMRDSCKLVAYRAKPLGISRGEYEIPAALGEPSGEGKA
jgi:hypothetical protein